MVLSTPATPGSEKLPWKTSTVFPAASMGTVMKVGGVSPKKVCSERSSRIPNMSFTASCKAWATSMGKPSMRSLTATVCSSIVTLVDNQKMASRVGISAGIWMVPVSVRLISTSLNRISISSPRMVTGGVFVGMVYGSFILSGVTCLWVEVLVVVLLVVLRLVRVGQGVPPTALLVVQARRDQLFPKWTSWSR